MPANVICETCKSEFMTPRTKSRTPRFCSRRCWGKTRVEHLTRIGPLGRSGWTPETQARANAKMRGPLNPAWKGGVTYFRKHGNYAPIKYVRCPLDLLPMARKDGYVMEHRLLMARAVGRPLLRAEVVHHVDHNPQNNAASNLELWPDNRSHKLAEHGRHVEGAANRLFLTESEQL